MTYPELRISWSKLRTYEECPQKVHLLRGGHASPAKNIRNYAHGMVVDRIMRNWLNNPIHTAGQMVAAVDEMIDSVSRDAVEDGDGVLRWRNVNDRADMREFCRELVRRLEPILREHVLPYPYENGLWFDVPIAATAPDGSPGVIRLIGEMDLLVNNDGWFIWDLKGTKDDTYWRKVVGQLVFYDIAVLGLHGTPSTRAGLIQPMCSEPILSFEVGDEHRRQIWTRILRMADSLWSKHMPCKEGTAGCSWCEVNHACPRYQPTGKTMSLGMALRQAAASGGTS